MQECPFVSLSVRDPDSFRLNAVHTGQPYMLNPSDYKELPFIIPTSVAASNTTEIVFKCPDFYVYAYDIRMTLYAYDSGAGTITRIDPNSVAGSVASPVYVSQFASDKQQMLTTREVHWTGIQGDARRPSGLAAPIFLGPGENVTFSFRNASASQQYACSIQLCGIRVDSGAAADELRRNLPTMEFVKAQRRYNTPLGPNPSENMRQAGVPMFLSVDADGDGVVTYASGTFAAPTTAPNQTILTLNRYTFFGSAWNGSQATGSTNRLAENTLPLMVKIRSRKFSQFYTDGFVPYGHVFGDQEYPGYMSVDYVLPENDAFVVEAVNLGAEVNCTYGIWGINRE